MKSAPPPVHQISLRLREIGQLFNSMDPTPFRHRDLDPNAEELIENWAPEFPSGSRYLLVIHFEKKPAARDAANAASACGPAPGGTHCPPRGGRFLRGKNPAPAGPPAGPMPAPSRKASSPAAINCSSVPKCAARSRAVWLPPCGPPSA